MLEFGRLIGNVDMHSGNLSLLVQPRDMAKGRGTLAPVYDMLPMCWRPDAALGGAPEYSPLFMDEDDANNPAAVPARAFWDALSTQRAVSRDLRRVAARMVDKLSGRG